MNSRLVHRQYIRLVIRDGGLCHYCNREMKKPDGCSKDAMSREHIVPRAFGGPNEDENMVLACRECNNQRGVDLYYCECKKCLYALDVFWYKRRFRDMWNSKKPRVYKRYGKWFVEIGAYTHAHKTWEQAHQTLFMRMLSEHLS